MKLSWNRYGKAGVRLVKIDRVADPHVVHDYTVDVQLEGGFERVYTDGDNANCLATDTMKNTVYAFAAQHEAGTAETFADRLAAHFVAQHAVATATVSIVEHRWTRLSVGVHAHPHAFVQPGADEWTAVVSRTATEASIRSGLRNLVVMKTTDSGFSGFPRDAYTTLPDTSDRILATSMTASWQYRQGTTDFSVRERVRATLLETFAAHDSRSVQHTLYAMGKAVIDACPDVDEITLALPNRHHLLVDLTPFGLDNPKAVFVATNQPYGLIEGTITRT
jgi:urate oxidase